MQSTSEERLPLSSENEDSSEELGDYFSPTYLPDLLDPEAPSPSIDDDPDRQHSPSGLDVLANESVLKNGYLFKKGELRKTWKRRWFVLKPAKLSYYKNDKEYELLRYLEVEKINAVAPVETKKRSFVFGLVTKERTFYIQGSSEDDMNAWIHAIKQATKARRLLLDKDKENEVKGSTDLKSLDVNSVPELKSGDLKSIPDLKGSSDMNSIPELRSMDTKSIPELKSSPDMLVPELKLTPEFIKDGSTFSDSKIPMIDTAVLPRPSQRTVSFADTPDSYVTPATPIDEAATDSDDDEFSTDELDSSQQSCKFPDNTILHQGYIHKLGSKYNKSWKKRWMVLRDGRVLCYKNEKEYELKRLIDLSDVVEVLPVDPLGKTHVHCFKIVQNKRSFIMCTATKEEQDTWLAYLNTALNSQNRAN